MIEEIAYAGWPRNVRLFNQTIELIITLDVGPRILRFSFMGGANVFKEYSEMLGKSGESEWRIRGGHRFWTAPEGPHSYALDNRPITFRALDDLTLEIEEAPQTEFGFQKILRVQITGEHTVTVTHRLKNIGSTPLTLSPWALSVMAPGGVALVPQPTLGVHPSELPTGTPIPPEDFLPNRKLVLWKYTNLSDPRFTWHPDFWLLRQTATGRATKIGLVHERGWLAYQNQGFVFCKKVTFEPSAVYPDDGVNVELFTNADMLEVESLAPAQPLAPGATTEHIEQWRLEREPLDLTDPVRAQEFFARLSAAP
jgi:hypothetical protein